MRDILDDPLFEKALHAAKLSDSENRMVKELARYAAEQAMTRVLDIAKTVPENISLATHIAAVAVLREHCNIAILTLIEALAKQEGMQS